MVRPNTPQLRSSHRLPNACLVFNGAADTAGSPGHHGDADGADSVLVEREEAAVASSLQQTAGAAAAHVDAAAPATSSSDLFPALLRSKKEQARLRADKKRVAKELSNAEKRRS